MLYSSSQIRVSTVLGMIVLFMCSTSQALFYSGPYGGTGGGNYNDCVSTYLGAGPITAIAVAYGTYINRIAFRYGSTSGQFHGGNLENVSALTVYLGANEHIRAVRGTHSSNVVTSLTFETTVRSFVIGKPSGTNFYASDSQGRYIRCVYGKSGSLLDSIGFGFGFLSETTPTEAQSSEAVLSPLTLEVAPVTNSTIN